MRAAIALGVALAVVGCDEQPRAPAYTARRIAEDEARASSQGAEPNRNERPPEPAVATDPGGGIVHNPWFWLFAGQTAYHALKPAPARARAPEHHHHDSPPPSRPSSPPPGRPRPIARPQGHRLGPTARPPAGPRARQATAQGRRAVVGAKHFQVRLQDVNPDTPVGRHMWAQAELLQKRVGGHPQGFAMIMSADVAQQGIDDGSWGPTALVQVDPPYPSGD